MGQQQAAVAHQIARLKLELKAVHWLRALCSWLQDQ